MTQVAQELVRAFRGEDRKLPDDLLPDAVSPNAQNVDYSKGTIRKRDGYTRLHGESIKEGGVQITNTSQNACVFIETHTDYDLVDDFSVEFMLRPLAYPAAGQTILITKRLSGSTAGWRFILQTDGTVRFNFFNGAGSNRAMDTGVLEIGKTYHVMAQRTGTAGEIFLDGASADTDTIDGETVTTRDVYIGADEGATPANDTGDFIISELRIWSDLRSASELARYKDQQLDTSELLDTNLVGYWPMTDARWGVVEDKAPNLNHGYFFTAGPTSSGNLFQPTEHGHGGSLRFDAGVENYAEAAYSAAYAPILDTGDTWTLEGWFRVDKGVNGADGTFFALGDIATGNGVAIRLLYDTSFNLKYIYSTTTTDSNVGVDTTYDIVAGVPFHCAIVRNGTTITAYINAQQVQQTTGVPAENGPTSDTSYGVAFGHRLASGGNRGSFASATLDEVRLWKSVRSQPDIEAWMNQEFLDVENSDLVGYWRFDAPDIERDETEFSDAVLSSDGDKPEWTYGLVYPADPPRLQLVAPFGQSLDADEVRSGLDEIHREIVVATHTDLFNLSGDRVRHLYRMVNPGIHTQFDWCLFQNKLILCNGLEPNLKYSDIEVPRTLTIAAPTTALTLAESGTGSGWTSAGRTYGDYSYRYSFRNDRDGTESAAGAVATIEVTTPKAQVDISDLEVSPNAEVTHVRIYRLDTAEGATVYRFLADVATGTTTATDPGTDVSDNDIIDELRGNPAPQHWCATYDNRLWFATANALIFSEAGTINFPPINIVTVDPSEGDVITGIRAAFGGLVVFKRRAIYFLSGHGATSFIIALAVAGTGCVAGQTIAESPGGLYFLGFDGVYLFNGTGVQYMSITQQDLFLTQNPELYHLACAAYDPKTHQYVVSFDSIDTNQTTLSFFDTQPGLYTNYYKLADNTDETGSADLTETDPPDYVTESVRGEIALFNGSTDEMEASIDAPTTTCVVGAWVKITNAVTDDQVILGIHTSGANVPVLLSINESLDLVQFRFDVTNSSSSTVIAFGPLGPKIGEWIHLVGVRETNLVKLYIDGKLVATKSLSGGFDGGAPAGLWVGHLNSSTFFDGAMSNAFYIDDAILEAWQVQEIYEYELEIIQNKTRLSLVFDEESNSWAKWDVGFDYLAIGSHSANRVEMLGGRDGYVNRLFDGGTDGGSVLTGTLINVSGAVSANGTATIEDTGAAFPTVDDGLAGAEILVQSSTDETTQRRLIIGNTATKLYLDRPFSPAITGTYYIAPIDFFWESRAMDFGDPSIVKRLYFTYIWLKESSTTVTFKWRSNDNETFQSTTFSTADEFVELITAMRGRKMIYRFEHVIPNEKVEIESFQGIFSAKRWL